MIGNGKSEAVTRFAARVYALVSEIPPGRVTTYGALARAMGCGSARAVGQALRKNPYAPEVPCHRVVASDGRIGGYHGEVSGELIERKIQRLRDEGVVWRLAERVDLARCGYDFPEGGESASE